MTREARNQRSTTGIKKFSYNKFSPLEDEIEYSFCNKFGQEESKCRRKFWPTLQKEKTSSIPRYGERRNSIRNMWHSSICIRTRESMVHQQRIL